MLFIIFLCFAHAIPILPISIEKDTPCSPILYTLFPDCSMDNNIQTITRTGFFWNGSLWTTHQAIASATKMDKPYTIQEQNPRANYVRMIETSQHEQWTSTTSVQKNNEILCIGFDKEGIRQERTGRVLEKSVSISWNDAPTPPLLKLSCPISSSMLGGVVTHNQKLVGMITAYQDEITYALPVERLKTSALQLGLHIEDEVALYSAHSDIPKGSEVLGIFRDYKKVSPPLIGLQANERIRIQLLEDDVWISPYNPQYNRIFIFEEREGAQYVLQPSLSLANLGLRDQDRWLPDQNTPIVAFYRGGQRLLILNPSWWESKDAQKTIK